MTNYSIPNDQVMKVSGCSVLRRYIGTDIGTVYLQDGCEVTIVLGKGSKLHIVNKGEEE